MSPSAVDITVVTARPEHVGPIAARMRQADRDEVAAASGWGPHQALDVSLTASSRAWTVLIDGAPEVMWGVKSANVLTGLGIPWLLGTDAVERHYVQFLRRSRPYLAELMRGHEELRNIVDERNQISVRWLRWMGFRFAPEPVAINGHRFREFRLRAGDV